MDICIQHTRKLEKMIVELSSTTTIRQLEKFQKVTMELLLKAYERNDVALFVHVIQNIYHEFLKKSISIDRVDYIGYVFKFDHAMTLDIIRLMQENSDVYVRYFILNTFNFAKYIQLDCRDKILPFRNRVAEQIGHLSDCIEDPFAVKSASDLQEMIFCAKKIDLVLHEYLLQNNYEEFAKTLQKTFVLFSSFLSSSVIIYSDYYGILQIIKSNDLLSNLFMNYESGLYDDQLYSAVAEQYGVSFASLHQFWQNVLKQLQKQESASVLLMQKDAIDHVDVIAAIIEKTESSVSSKSDQILMQLAFLNIQLCRNLIHEDVASFCQALKRLTKLLNKDRVLFRCIFGYEFGSMPESFSMDLAKMPAANVEQFLCWWVITKVFNLGHVAYRVGMTHKQYVLLKGKVFSSCGIVLQSLDEDIHVKQQIIEAYLDGDMIKFASIAEGLYEKLRDKTISVIDFIIDFNLNANEIRMLFSNIDSSRDIALGEIVTILLRRIRCFGLDPYYKKTKDDTEFGQEQTSWQRYSLEEHWRRKPRFGCFLNPIGLFQYKVFLILKIKPEKNSNTYMQFTWPWNINYSAEIDHGIEKISFAKYIDGLKTLFINSASQINFQELCEMRDLRRLLLDKSVIEKNHILLQEIVDVDIDVLKQISVNNMYTIAIWMCLDSEQLLGLRDLLLQQPVSNNELKVTLIGFMDFRYNYYDKTKLTENAWSVQANVLCIDDGQDGSLPIQEDLSLDKLIRSLLLSQYDVLHAQIEKIVSSGNLSLLYSITRLPYILVVELLRYNERNLLYWYAINGVCDRFCEQHKLSLEIVLFIQDYCSSKRLLSQASNCLDLLRDLQTIKQEYSVSIERSDFTKMKLLCLELDAILITHLQNNQIDRFNLTISMMHEIFLTLQNPIDEKFRFSYNCASRILINRGGISKKHLLKLKEGQDLFRDESYFKLLQINKLIAIAYKEHLQVLRVGSFCPTGELRGLLYCMDNGHIASFIQKTYLPNTYAEEVSASLASCLYADETIWISIMQKVRNVAKKTFIILETARYAYDVDSFSAIINQCSNFISDICALPKGYEFILNILRPSKSELRSLVLILKSKNEQSLKMWLIKKIIYNLRCNDLANDLQFSEEVQTKLNIEPALLLLDCTKGSELFSLLSTMRIGYQEFIASIRRLANANVDVLQNIMLIDLLSRQPEFYKLLDNAENIPEQNELGWKKIYSVMKAIWHCHIVGHLFEIPINNITINGFSSEWEGSTGSTMNKYVQKFCLEYFNNDPFNVFFIKICTFYFRDASSVYAQLYAGVLSTIEKGIITEGTINNPMEKLAQDEILAIPVSLHIVGEVGHAVSAVFYKNLVMFSDRGTLGFTGMTFYKIGNNQELPNVIHTLSSSRKFCITVKNYKDLQKSLKLTYCDEIYLPGQLMGNCGMSSSAEPMIMAILFFNLFKLSTISPARRNGNIRNNEDSLSVAHAVDKLHCHIISSMRLKGFCDLDEFIVANNLEVPCLLYSYIHLISLYKLQDFDVARLSDLRLMDSCGNLTQGVEGYRKKAKDELLDLVVGYIKDGIIGTSIDRVDATTFFNFIRLQAEELVRQYLQYGSDPQLLAQNLSRTIGEILITFGSDQLSKCRGRELLLLSGEMLHQLPLPLPLTLFESYTEESRESQTTSNESARLVQKP